MESLEAIERQLLIPNEQQIELESQQAGGGPGRHAAAATSNLQKQRFIFDRVFGNSSTQAMVYEEVQHLIASFLNGHDVCIFSYGQTGSGKTYTMGTDCL